MYLLQGIAIKEVSIIKNGKSSGCVRLPKPFRYDFYSPNCPEHGRDLRELALMILLSGYAAEMLFTGEMQPRSHFSEIDKTECEKIMATMATIEYSYYIDWLCQRTFGYLAEEHGYIETIAHKLIKRNSLKYRSIGKIPAQVPGKCLCSLSAYFLIKGGKPGSLMRRRSERDPKSQSARVQRIMRHLQQGEV
jgi:hypothetical protein